MVSDEERREVAARLKELASANEGLLGDERMTRVLVEAQITLGTIGLASVADVILRYADLIDRPTCRITDTDHEFEDSVRCDRCKTVFRRPWEPFRFCPHCGAEVAK